LIIKGLVEVDRPPNSMGWLILKSIAALGLFTTGFGNDLVEIDEPPNFIGMNLKSIAVLGLFTIGFGSGLTVGFSNSVFKAKKTESAFSKIGSAALAIEL